MIPIGFEIAPLWLGLAPAGDYAHATALELGPLIEWAERIGWAGSPIFAALWWLERKERIAAYARLFRLYEAVRNISEPLAKVVAEGAKK